MESNDTIVTVITWGILIFCGPVSLAIGISMAVGLFRGTVEDWKNALFAIAMGAGGTIILLVILYRRYYRFFHGLLFG